MEKLVFLAALHSLLAWSGQHHNFTAKTRLLGWQTFLPRYSLKIMASKTHWLLKTSWFSAINFYQYHRGVRIRYGLMPRAAEGGRPLAGNPENKTHLSETPSIPRHPEFRWSTCPSYTCSIMPCSGCPALWGATCRAAPGGGDKQGAEGNPLPDRPHQGTQPYRVHQGVNQDQGVPSRAKGDGAGHRAWQGHPSDIARIGAQGWAATGSQTLVRVGRLGRAVRAGSALRGQRGS